jgi:hypothetical protein
MQGVAVLLLAACASYAVASDGASSIRADAIHGHIAFLADDALEGRGTATRGHELAAAYVSSQFASYGLQPAGDHGSWYQTVPLLESSAVISGASARLERDGSMTELTAKEDFLPRASFWESDLMLSGPMTFVGFGVHAPELNYDDFAGVNLSGRIVVILAGAPAALPVDQRAYYASVAVKGAELTARGAIGVITIGPPAEDQTSTWERRVLMSWLPAMRATGEDGRPLQAFPQLRGGLLLSPSGAAKVFSGAAHTLDEVYASADQSKVQSFDLPGSIHFTTKSALAKRSSMNVVALLEGSDPKLKSEYVVLSAHLDHLGVGAAVAGDSIYNGALDNASGIAMMLEAARVLKFRAGKLRRSVLFVAFTGEEKGLLGSEYFLRRPTVPRSAIVADINIDMPIALTTFTDLVAFGADHSTLGRVALAAAKRESLRLAPDPEPDEVRFVRSDQFAFVRNGIPALQMDAGTHAARKGIDGNAVVETFRRSRYHMPGDDRDQPIDYAFLATLARVNLHIVYDVANTRERQQWNSGDFFAGKANLASGD